MYTSFSEVTAALSKKLHDLKYSDGTIQKYEREWTRFENYLSKNNIEQYDMETVKDYFFSKYILHGWLDCREERKRKKRHADDCGVCLCEDTLGSHRRTAATHVPLQG